MSPWQGITPVYIFGFFSLTLLVGALLVFSELSIKHKLGLLCVYSFVLHSYLPLSHELIYGADGWRHIADINQLLAGHWPVKPLLANGTRAGFSVGDIAYGLFWVVCAAFSRLFGAIIVVKWLQVVLFSVSFPLLLWQLTKYLGFSERVSLFTIFLANLPFALQVAGSFSLPVNFGFLFFLGGLVILAAHAHGEAWATRRLLVLYCIVLAVNYLLYLIVFVIAWAVLESLRSGIIYSSRLNAAVAVGALVVLIPVIELVFGYSRFSPFSLWEAIKQLFGNFSAWYIAAGPRPHDIATGNILFNQVPQSAFVPNLFTYWRWWLPLFSIGFWVSVGLGITRALRTREAEHSWLPLLTAGLFGGYIIGRYVLGGDQLISRRLEATLALLFILCFGYFKESLVSRLPAARQPRMWVIMLIVAGIGITTSYSLGPDAHAVSSSAYRAMQSVWDDQKTEPHYCVVSDTYSLAALEAISDGKIVGGGFPINANFGQPELTEVWQYLNDGIAFKNPNAMQYLKSRCWFVNSQGYASLLQRQ